MTNQDNARLITRILSESPAVLAPMAGITDKIFRRLVRERGGGLAYTEMISAKALVYANQKTRDMLDISDDQGDTAIQLFGSEPDIMAEASIMAQEAGATFIDINMGCPVSKVVKNGEGSALLEKPELAAKIVSAMAKACALPISVKIRLGVSADRIVTPDFAVRMREAGASLIAAHARTRDQYYGGKADWEQIRLIKQAIDIPLIGNGDVRTPEDAVRMTRETGCDAVMIGRACLGDPWLPGRINRYLLASAADRDSGDAHRGPGDVDRIPNDVGRIPDAAGRIPGESGRFPDAIGKIPNDVGRIPDAADRISMALEHCRLLIALKGEKKALPEIRKHFAWYLKGLPRTSALKNKLFHCATYDEARELLEEYMSEI